MYKRLEFVGFIDALGENISTKDDVNCGTNRGARIALRFDHIDLVAITPRLIYQEIEIGYPEYLQVRPSISIVHRGSVQWPQSTPGEPLQER